MAVFSFMFEKIKTFLIESRQELKRVNWPRKEETVRYTIFVIALSVGLAVFLGILDYVFIQILQKAVL
jgi:preprotein translocase subunit SecE